jgi:hypothetical protein
MKLIVELEPPELVALIRQVILLFTNGPRGDHRAETFGSSSGREPETRQ